MTLTLWSVCRCQSHDSRGCYCTQWCSHHGIFAGGRATTAGVSTVGDDIDTMVCLQVPESEQQGLPLQTVMLRLWSVCRCQALSSQPMMFTLIVQVPEPQQQAFPLQMMILTLWAVCKYQSHNSRHSHCRWWYWHYGLFEDTRATTAGVPTADDDIDTMVCLQIPEPQQQVFPLQMMILTLWSVWRYQSHNSRHSHCRRWYWHYGLFEDTRATTAGIPTADDDVDTMVCLQIPEPQQQAFPLQTMTLTLWSVCRYQSHNSSWHHQCRW